MSYDTARPHIASYIVFRKEGKVAFLLRSGTSWMNGYYGLPAGKVENDESFTAGAVREAKEEVGVNIKSQHLKPLLTIHRKAYGHAPLWVDVYFEAERWEGDLINAEPTVHSEITWLDPSNLPENVIPAVTFAIEQIQAGQTYAEYGW